MKFYKILIACLLFSSFPFMHLAYFSDSTFLDILRISISPIAGIIYFFLVKEKKFFLTVFFILFAFADFLNFFAPWMSFNVFYFVINSIYVIAYLSLFLEIIRTLNFQVIKKYKVPTLILAILSVYVIVTLQYITNIVDEQFYMELAINTSVVIVLSASLLHFFYYNDNKSFNLFIGSFFLVIQECIAIGYLYIGEGIFTYIMWCVFTALSFYFLIKQAQLTYKPKDSIFT